MAEIDEIYKERNAVVAALARLAWHNDYKVWIARHDINDLSWDPEWRNILFIETDAGQFSWHIHDSELHLFDGLPRLHEWASPSKHDLPAWDGHTTEQKYKRLARWCPIATPTK